MVVYNKGNTGIAAMGFIMSQEKYFNRLATTSALAAEKMLQPSLTSKSILRLYAKKELMDAKVKISMIEEKTSIRFGLGAFDEKKNDREGQVELVSVGQSGMEKARSMEVDDQKEVEVFLGGFEGEFATPSQKTFY